MIGYISVLRVAPPPGLGRTLNNTLLYGSINGASTPLSAEHDLSFATDDSWREKRAFSSLYASFFLSFLSVNSLLTPPSSALAGLYSRSGVARVSLWERGGLVELI